MSPAMSSLASHHYFVKLCCPCHSCVVLLFKGSYHLSQFLYIPLDLSYESNLSSKCQYDIFPKSHQFSLVRCLCWMMWDTSMPSFQWSHPVDFNSLSRPETRDLYSTLGPTVLSGRLFLTIDSEITLLSSDR